MFLLRALFYVAECAYLLWVLPGAGQAFFTEASQLATAARQGEPAARAFLAGAIAFVPLAWLARGWLRFWYALAHEVTHSLTAVLLGGQPGEMMVAESGGGEVRFARAPIVVWLVLLAPYVVSPSYLVPPLVPWLSARARVAGAVAAGVATGFALVSNALQVRAYQSDIQRSGLVRSLLFIAWGNLVACALAMALVSGGYPAAWRVIRAGFWGPG